MVQTINVGPVYPPSMLDDFQRCPLFWDLKKRWRNNPAKEWTANHIGTAVAKGLEYFFKGASREDALLKGDENIRANYPQRADRSLKGVVELTRQGIELAMDTSFSFKEILAVEEPFSRIRPDIEAYDYDGALIVVDHKVKVELDDRYYEKELLKYDTSNQFYEYAWAIGAKYGEPVEWVFAHIIILGPSPRTVLHPVKMTPEHVKHWLHGASREWHHMKAIEEGEEEPQARYTGCITPYGPCAMHEGCHTFHGDESAFPAIYERVKSRYA